MFRRRQHKRGTFLPFVIFRLLLSVVIFALLLGGAYSAFQSFSGINPAKVDPKSLILNLLTNYPEAQALVNKLLPDQFKVQAEKVAQESGDNVLGQINIQPNSAPTPAVTAEQNSIKHPLFTFALVADSHNENGYLKKALDQAKSRSIKFIIGLGDYTEVGTVNELAAAKKEFDETGVRYFLTAGDHDLWESRNKSQPAHANFYQVFGNPYQSFSVDNVHFLIIYNADNYDGLSSKQWSWLQGELGQIKNEPHSLSLAFLHEPLYHPSSDHVMGRVTPGLKDQAKRLTAMLAGAGVKGVFAGDIHFFTQYSEPESGVPMTTLGAVASQRNVQLPRYGIVTVFDDYSYSVEDVEIK